MATINDAISAYKSTVKRASDFNPGGDAEAASEGPSFGSLMKSAVTGAIDAAKKGEAVSQSAIMGKADMTEVAQAVNNADITLQSVVAIRDKVVSAYQQIMQMPI
jgi:flagellar hook-basal body complex protein FliE